MSLINQAPSGDKKQHGREDRGRSVPSIASRDMRGKAKPASELEAQWKKEEDMKKAQEDEARRLEEEKRRQEEEKAEEERLEKVWRIVHSVEHFHSYLFMNDQMCRPITCICTQTVHKQLKITLS